MATRDFEIEGYVRFLPRDGVEPHVGILVPRAIVLEMQAAIMAEKAAQKTSEFLGGKPLPKLPLNSDQSMVAALAFAKKFLAGVPPPPLLTAKFSADLLAGVLVECAHSDPRKGWDDVLNYLIDPLWDCAIQMLLSFQDLPVIKYPSAARWLKQFMLDVKGIPSDGGGLPKAAHKHWKMALEKRKKSGKRKASACEQEPAPKPVSPSVVVFDPEELENAVTRLTEMPSERQNSGRRILEKAREEFGIRRVPDALAAARQLDAKKLEFENLAEPIERLQTDLILASKMDPKEFRVSPILLLGEPGIGKTYLATQLADVLGVPSDKVSAGGAQGGFQLTGSHATWTGAKPGAIATLLALSTSAAPVMVIDEVDKIGNDTRYPFLPVLLDLLDAGTARQFRDDYFEMTFNAGHILYVLTANSIENVPPALLSRVEVFVVPPPDPEQRLRIIQQTLATLNQKTHQQIRMVDGGAEQLAEKTDIDLRQLNRLVTTAFAKVTQSGGQELDIGDRNVTAALKATLERMSKPIQR